MHNSLKEACIIRTGKLDSNQAIQSGQYPFFTCSELPSAINHYAFDDDVVLIAGNNANGNFHINRYTGKFNAYQRTYILSAKPGQNIDFIYYSLKLELKRLQEKSQGSQTKFLTMPILNGIELRRFERKDEINIGHILSTLDRKIELNNKINSKLESIAKAIYDYWFVQFDFPDSNGKPYKANGGKMIWNENLKKEIPEDWHDGQLKDLANIQMGQSPPGESYNNDGNGMIFFQGCTDFGNRFPAIRQFTNAPTRFAKKGDILLSVRAPVGTLNFANKDCCIGRGLAALNSKDNCIAYLYGVMINLKQTFDRRNVNGTTFGSITKDDLFSLPVIRPTTEILMKYQSMIDPVFKKQNIIELENMQLRQLRDWLLPMLMNGQVSIVD